MNTTIQDGDRLLGAVEPLTNHCFAAYEWSFSERHTGERVMPCRRCPLCEREVIALANNFENHMRLCCFNVYTNLKSLTNSLYFRSHSIKVLQQIKKSMPHVTTLDRPAIRQYMKEIARQKPIYKRYHVDKNTHSSTGDSEGRIAPINYQTTAVGLSLGDSYMTKQPRTIISHRAKERVLASPENIWFYNPVTYVQQQIGNAYGPLSVATEQAKELLHHQWDNQPVRNDNMRTVIHDKHFNDYKDNCNMLNYIFTDENESSQMTDDDEGERLNSTNSTNGNSHTVIDSGTNNYNIGINGSSIESRSDTSSVFKNLDYRDGTLQTLNNDIALWEGKLSQISQRVDLPDYLKRKGRDYETDPMEPSKRPKLTSGSFVTF